MTDPTSAVDERAALHRALGDETRLRIVDALQLSDRSPKQLGRLTGVPTNLLAFHLGVLERAGLIARTASQGDGRRRYVTLVQDRLALLTEPRPLATAADHVLFVCTANSARSQLAAHLWHARTGRPALSAGTTPAERVHPGAVAVAARRGLDLGHVQPVSYHQIEVRPDLVVSVCDRAHEATLPFDAPVLHWSVPDPVPGEDTDFEAAFDAIAARIDRLARAVPA